jgi:GT2 family glycosyltransferase
MRRAGFRAAQRLWWRLPAPARDRLRDAFFSARGRGSRPAPVRPAPARVPPRPPATTDAAVSVVMPTLDAGPLFERVLAALAGQTGLRELELLVLDSGSSDGTREAAERAGARVIDVPAGTFGHGRTRNLGAEAARHPLLLMLSQDAVLLGRDAVARLAQELERGPSLAAVSARQVPRSDADLYACYVAFAHRAVMAEARRGPLQRRAAAAVDDVCAAIRRPVWEQLRFRDLPFAEDVDFGLRAADAGWQVATSDDVAVAHSHTRGAPDAFRRAAADRICIAPLLDDRRRVRAAAEAPETVLQAARLLTGRAAAAAALPAGEAPLGEHLDRFRDALRRLEGAGAPAGEFAELAAILPEPAAGARRLERCTGYLRDDLLAVLTWPTLHAFSASRDAVRPDEVAAFAARLTAAVIGRAVGDAVLEAGDRAAVETLLQGV